MSDLYYCKECRQLDEKGRGGHHTRCNPVVANPPPEKVANEIKVVANKSRHGVYKDKESRLAYMRELMRKRRAA